MTRYPEHLIRANTSGRWGAEGTATRAARVLPTEPFMVGIHESAPPHHGVVAKLGPTTPTPSEGGGGWEEVTMPKRGAVMVWKGRGLLKLTLSVLFDNFGAGRGVGSEYATLLGMWRPDHDTSPPSIVRLTAMGDTIPYADLEYVITGLEWGEAEADPEGVRTQQILTLTFTEYRPDERLRTASEKKKKHGKKTTTVEIKHDGESLGAIADHYHVKGGWKALGAAQHPPIKDSRHTHKGQKIIVPLP